MQIPVRLAMAAGLFAACAPPEARAGDWQALSDTLTAAGVKPLLTYEGDASSDLSGGARQGSTYTDNLHVQLELDGNRLIGVTGLSAFLDGLWINGGQPSKLVGDAQGVSNIAGPAAVRVYEAWVQYNFADNAFLVLGGRYDLNTEFYRLVSADVFLNSSFGIGAELGRSGFAGRAGSPVSAPETSVELTWLAQATSWLTLQPDAQYVARQSG